MTATLRERLKAPEPVFGTFIKTPTHHVIEIAGLAGLDFVALDAEHAPFSANALDVCLLACAAAKIPGIVRISDASPASVLQALDLGAAGVLVPHISSREQAEAVVAATRYRGGMRGFSNSPRAGRYGRTAMSEHRASSDESVAVIAQIEDPQAVDRADEIMSTPGIDAVLIGRADLAVAYGVDSIDTPVIENAVRNVLLAAGRSGIPCGVAVSTAAEVRGFIDMGVRFFVVGSDQSVLLRGWTSIVETAHSGPGVFQPL
jgi:2-keto-3-deoxy-L-rhamnonate aldolase RhmA